MTTVTIPETRRLRSTAAVLGGFLSVAVLSLGTNQVLHVLNVYPPWGEPMYETRLNLLALLYRVMYTILGGYITAALAPHSPMRHVLIVGILGTVAGVAGAVAAMTMAVRPGLDPIALAVTGFPWVWVGGVFTCGGTRRSSARAQPVAAGTVRRAESRFRVADRRRQRRARASGLLDE